MLNSLTNENNKKGDASEYNKSNFDPHVYCLQMFSDNDDYYYQ